jgi:hypothetical protein
MVIDNLLNSNALSVNGNILNNATSSDGSVVSTATVDPTAVSAETSPSVFDPDAAGDSSSGTLTPSTTTPSLFSGYVVPQRLLRRQATASTTSSSARSAESASSTSRSTTNYLGAVMASANLTVGGLLTASPSATPSATGGGGGGGTSQSLAMIILYAITGLVVCLFVVVIASGALRAWRHPERYGPRAMAEGRGGGRGNGDGGEQTRTRGLTRAILDTFPVVRFGGGGGEERTGRDEEEGVEGASKAREGEEDVELTVLPVAAPVQRSSTALEGEEEQLADDARRGRSDSRSSVGRESFHSAVSAPLQNRPSVVSLSSGDALMAATTAAPLSRPPPALTLPPPIPSTSSSSPPSTSPPRSLTTATDSSVDLSPPLGAVQATGAGVAAAGGADEAESCPICFTEFEAGDELRVLPCDARHIFHVPCIDPVRLLFLIVLLSRRDFQRNWSQSSFATSVESDFLNEY